MKFKTNYLSSGSGRRGVAVYQKDSAGHQRQSRKPIERERLIIFSQPQSGQYHPEHGIHKTEYCNTADRIVFQQNPPQAVCYCGNHGHIEEKQNGLWREPGEAAAHKKTCRSQNQAAQHKLPAAEHDGVFCDGKFFYKDGGQGVGKRGDENEALSVYLHMKIKRTSCQINEDHPREPGDAAEKFLTGKFFIAENQAGHKNGEKCAGCVDDGRLYPGGIGKADIKEKILDDCLRQSQQTDGKQGTAAGRQKFPGSNTAEKNHQNAGQKEAQSRKQDLPRCVGGGDGEHLVSDFYRGKCAAPQEAADERQKTDDGRFGQQFLIHSCSILSLALSRGLTEFYLFRGNEGALWNE